MFLTGHKKAILVQHYSGEVKSFEPVVFDDLEWGRVLQQCHEFVDTYKTYEKDETR
jgi:hypothetical protein